MRVTSLLVFCVLLLFQSCSSAQKNAPQQKTDIDSQVADLQAAVIKLNERIQFQEDKIASLNDQLAAAQTSLQQARAGSEPPATRPHPSTQAGESVSLQDEPLSQMAFEDSDAVSKFRNATVLFDSQKYAEAILAFSQFLKEYADHPLAGAAQYFTGEAYFQQKEYGLALKEFNRVLVSYDRSTHVSDAIARVADCQEKLGQKIEAIRGRETLVSLFPQSPLAPLARAPKSGSSAEMPQESAPARALVPETAPMTSEAERLSPHDAKTKLGGDGE